MKVQTKDYWKSVFNAKDPVSNAIETEKRGQANKSAGWMPWH